MYAHFQPRRIEAEPLREAGIEVCADHRYPIALQFIQAQLAGVLLCRSSTVSIGSLMLHKPELWSNCSNPKRSFISSERTHGSPGISTTYR
jgi:hypothetical protein